MSKADKAAEAWRKLFGFFMSTRSQRDRVLEKHKLTPNDAKALSALKSEGRTMRSLAEAWSCDASNATWMVDRLEKRGLAKREGQPGDRRVTLVSLTARGAQLKAKVQSEMEAPPPQLLELDSEALDVLNAALSKLDVKRED
ncbi:MAG: MarR family transcriptional regulator [Archangium sp.]